MFFQSGFHVLNHRSIFINFIKKGISTKNLPGIFSFRIRSQYGCIWCFTIIREIGEIDTFRNTFFKGDPNSSWTVGFEPVVSVICAAFCRDYFREHKNCDVRGNFIRTRLIPIILPLLFCRHFPKEWPVAKLEIGGIIKIYN